MNLSELPGLLFAGLLERWKRRAVVYAICAVCALGIAIESIAIGRILLERTFGPIGGRLFVAGILILVMAAALLTLWQLERRSRLAHAAQNAQAAADNDPRVALIAQAINLGYTFARGFGNDRPEPPVSEPEDSNEAMDERPAARAAE